MSGRRRAGVSIVAAVIALNLVLLTANVLLFVKNTAKDPPPAGSQYPLLAKRIFAEDQSDIIINFIDLRAQLREYARPRGDSFGMYFEYLPSGVSIGVNEKKETRLASLSKVPTVMAAYHMVYAGKLSEGQLLTITDKNRDNTFGNLWRKAPGEKVSVRDAARLAITDSDNTAHNVLLDVVPLSEINAVYDSLDIPFDQQNGYPIISTKSYSSVLRALFLSSYLPKEYSNKVLATMTQTIYTDKIPGKLPDSIQVAHKIGVFARQAPEVSSYSDCGIVYVPNRPYALCMMESGDETAARQHMSEVSKMIYDYVKAADGHVTARE